MRLKLLFLIALSACGSDDRQVTQYQGVGAVCLSPRSAGGSHIQVVLDACVSACAEVEGSCSASVSDDVVELVAAGSSTTNHGAEDSCPLHCLAVEATCLLPAVPAGTYDLRYGTRTTRVVLPVANAKTEVLQGAGSTDCAELPALP